MDLHSGLPFWLIKNELYDYFNPLQDNYTTDVAIIGSGITGALVSHELCKAGISCCVIDKRGIATGSTVASTALLQYEIDVPLCKLIESVGRGRAIMAYHSSLQAITDIKQVFEEICYRPGFERVSNVYYASDRDSLSMIEKEYIERLGNGLPATFVERDELAHKYGISAPGALWNNVSAQMDAYQGATALLKYHMKTNRLDVFSHTEIVDWDEIRQGYKLKTKNGYKIACKYLVIAAGFESGTFLPKQVMALTSTYALVSQPVTPDLFWPERSLIWETAEPYLYVRTTDDNRIMVGGEDVDFKDPERRDKLLRKKIRTLERKFRKLFPDIPFVTDMAWCGTFSSTPDGLPYIGAQQGNERLLFALGYGGNGILFSMIAAQIIKNKLMGVKDDRETVFGFEREK